MAGMRIAEAAAQTRALDEYRHLDQAERAQAQRVAGETALKDIERQHQQVEESHRTVEQQDEQERHPGQRREASHESEEEPKEKKEPRTPLECSEGHLLDVKA